jgi:hypothetical protein
MRKLLIFGILAASVAVVVVMTSMRPAPPKKERVELDPLVEVLVLKEMTANFEVRSQGLWNDHRDVPEIRGRWRV